MQSIRLRSKVTLFLLVADMVVAIVASWSTWTMIGYLTSVRDGGPIDAALGERIDDRQAILGILQLALVLVCAVAFMMWMHRAYKNLKAVRLAGLQYSPAWAVGGFLVPFLNFVRPYQVMREIWTASVFLAGDAPGVEDWRRIRPDVRVPLWWTLFLLMNVAGNVSGRMMLAAKEIDSITAAAWVTLASDLLDIPAAIAAIAVVRAVSGRLERARSQVALRERAAVFAE